MRCLEMANVLANNAIHGTAAPQSGIVRNVAVSLHLPNHRLDQLPEGFLSQLGLRDDSGNVVVTKRLVQNLAHVYRADLTLVGYQVVNVQLKSLGFEHGAIFEPQMSYWQRA